MSRAAAPSKTDLARVRAMPESDIQAGIESDPDTVEFTDQMLKSALVTEPAIPSKPVLLRVAADVLAFYKQGGPGYQTRMNKVLRLFMEQSARRAKP